MICGVHLLLIATPHDTATQAAGKKEKKDKASTAKAEIDDVPASEEFSEDIPLILVTVQLGLARLSVDVWAAVAASGREASAAIPRLATWVGTNDSSIGAKDEGKAFA